MNDDEKKENNIPWLETDEGKTWQKKWLELEQNYRLLASASGNDERR